MLLIISIIINFAALFIIFHYFKWKLTSYNFLEGFEKKKGDINYEIDAMLVEINRTTERNLQILEAKINQLNEVVLRSEKIFNAVKKEQTISVNTEDIYHKLERKSFNDSIVKHADAATAAVPVKEDIREKVISMHRNGIDVELISRNLGITSGEVELMISINNIK
jgi:hypothetical protein